MSSPPHEFGQMSVFWGTRQHRIRYLEDHSSLFGYQDYDESMQPDDPEYDLDNYFNPNDKIRIDEYSADRPKDERLTYLKYSQIPPIDGMHYMPPPFRHKFEIWIWRVDIQNVAKIKHYYFTPEVINSVSFIISPLIVNFVFIFSNNYFRHILISLLIKLFFLLLIVFINIQNDTSHIRIF